MTGWTPPPPGDRREQLPNHLLAAIDIPTYTSTACEAAGLAADAIPGRPDLADELAATAERLHLRCRLQNKYTGVACGCDCHQQ